MKTRPITTASLHDRALLKMSEEIDSLKSLLNEGKPG